MLFDIFDTFLKSRKWLTALALVNFAGLLFGLYYYSYQLAITPWYLWFFTIDSPLYVTFFGVVCLLLLKNKKIPDLFLSITAIGLIKVGFWTDVVLTLYRSQFFSADPVITAVNFPLHVGMILEGIALLRFLRLRPIHLPIVIGWFLFNDYLDYVVGTVTLIPEGYKGLLFAESVAASVIVPLIMFLIQKVVRPSAHGSAA